MRDFRVNFRVLSLVLVDMECAWIERKQHILGHGYRIDFILRNRVAAGMIGEVEDRQTEIADAASSYLFTVPDDK